jgi:hypothetical protein
MRYRRVFGLLAVAPLIGAGLAGVAGAAAGTPVVAGLTITPSTVGAGASAGLVATATNTTGAPVNVSLGVNLPNGVSVSAVSGTGGCTPRMLTRLIYCGAIGVPSGASAAIAFSVTPTAAGSYAFQSYARVMYSSTNSTASETLTAH